MRKLYKLNYLSSAMFFIATFILSLNSYSQTLSPTINVSLSNLDCGQLSDLSIDVSQDPGETDIATSVFTSDAGSFDLAGVSVGDTLGTADMTLTGGLTVNSTLIVGSTSSYSTIVLSVDNSGTLGSFTLRNDSNGIEITATSPGDGNNVTGGYTSNATFHNLFQNPSTSVVTFYSTITSELGQVDNQSFVQFMSCSDFSPQVSLTLANNDCGLLTDVTIDVSQDAGEIDMATSLFTTDGGSFDLSSLSVGAMVGYATVSVGSNSYTADLFVSSVSGNVATIIENLTSQSFTIENLSGGGVSIYSVSPGDNNYTTLSGNSSSVTLENIFINTGVGVLAFNSTITSEIGQVASQSINTLMSCSDFSPTVSTSLSNYDCDSVSSLTISVSQDAGETDMDHALFVTDAGSFDISSLIIGDNIGSASLTNGLGTYTTNLYVSSLTSTTAIVSDSLGNTFDIENLPSGGVSIDATSPGDNNTLTSGNSSTVTFNDLFLNPNTGMINLNSTITSELGEVDAQSFVFYMSCMDFSPTVSVSLSDTICNSHSDLTIDVSQDAGETDIASALFVSDGGSFDISGLGLNDVVGTANIVFASGISVVSTLEISLINSIDDFEVQSVDALGNVLGTFAVTNTVGGGVSILATSPPDGNSSTNGYVSTATFNNLFVNPTSSTLGFTTAITSELGDVDTQSFVFNISCDFSPSVSISLSDNTCNSHSDLSIDVSQDAGETDIASALFVSDGGSFDISGLNLNDVVGTANILFANGTSVISTLELSVITTLDDFEIQSVDSLGNVLGTFAVTNSVGGGVSILATSPPDGNSTTNGYVSTATFNNLFVNPNTSSLNFTTTITSEIGDVDTQSFSYLICCDPFLTVTITECDSYVWDGVTYDSTGTYTNVYTDVNGCDSTVTLDLTINYSQSLTVTVTECDSYVWDGVTYDSTGTYTNVYTDVNGCDSTVTLDLTINYSLSQTVIHTACDSFVWDGVTYDSTGTYTNVYTDVNGCDSTVTLDLTINYSQSSTVTVTECDSYVWDGVTYDSTGTYTNVYIGANGCDSTVTLDLTINYSQSSTVTVTECDSYVWDGVTYDSTGTYTNVYTDVNGCDSTVTLDLTINYSQSLTVTVTECDSYVWDGVTYDSTGTYTNVYTDVNGCDSTVTLDLTINYSQSSTVTVTAWCNFDWDGVTYDSTGTYTNVYIGANGCDSIVTLDLTIDNNISSTVTVTECDSYVWDGVTYDSTGTYTNVYTASNGCDSTVTLDLTINYSQSSTVTVTECDSYVWDGVTYDSTGTYTNVYTDVNGCDSTVTLDLTINYSQSSTVTVTACDSFDWDGVTYDSTGTYTNVYTGANGCDSTVILDLTINYSTSSTVTVTACDSFDWDGVTYDSTGTYTNIYTDVNGCDSIVTLDLTIHESPSDATVTQNGDSLTVTVTTGTPPYTYLWNTNETTQSILPDSSGSYYCVVTDANGCSDWSNQYTYTSTSVQNISYNNLTIYPNPTRGLLNIEFENIDNKISEVSVVNVLGDKIYNDNLDNKTFKYSSQIDLSKYSNGIYFVRFKTKDGFVTKKLILQ